MKNSTGDICKLCGVSSALVQSHIIPRAFFDAKGREPLKIVSNAPGHFPQRSPIGVYDYIVCDSCEKSFSLYDDYAAKVLLQNVIQYKRVEYQEQLLALHTDRVDYSLLKLFAISVLWRAAVSSHYFYKKVKLGPFERRAREMLDSKDPGSEDEFATWWAIFDVQNTPAIMDPFRERYSGVNVYRFYFGKVLGYIKVDSQSIPDPFDDLVLAPDRGLILVGRDYEQSKDRNAMRTVLRTALRGKASLF